MCRNTSTTDRSKRSDPSLTRKATECRREARRVSLMSPYGDVSKKDESYSATTNERVLPSNFSYIDRNN